MFSAVLDACVLFPQSLRDALIRLAEAELYTPLWSERILEEMRSSLVEDRGIHLEKADRTVSLMREAFEEAEVDAIKIASLEPAMTNDEKDRHVLATAVASGSELVVTFNVSDFPSTACEPVGVAAVHPDEFLSDLVDLDADTVYRVIAELVAALRTTNFVEFLEMLENAGVPCFVAESPELVVPRLRPLRYYGAEAAPREKGVDVDMAVEALRFVLADECDVAVLFTHDTDLLPAVEGIADLKGESAVETASWVAEDFRSRLRFKRRIYHHGLDRNNFARVEQRVNNAYRGG